MTESELLEDVYGYARQELTQVLSRCESPIESLMAAALLRQFGSWPEIGMACAPGAIGFVPGVVNGEYPAFKYVRSDGASIFVVPQLLLSIRETTYRLDFSVVERSKDRHSERFVAVECDGHDFHDRTKAQASRDRSRDRALQSAGWRVLRFTGSDIVSDPTRAANEVLEFIKAKEGT